jgi:quercetin dioxygenase-like cupin family protein
MKAALGDVSEEATVSPDYSVVHLGATLKARRLGRFTVEELSARSGVSAGLISQIERGIGNPSFVTLVRLAQALDVPLAELFVGARQHENRILVRRNERLRMELPADGTLQELLVPDVDRKLAMIQMSVPPRFSGEEIPHSHAGEEVVLLVSGSLRVTIGDQTFELEEGDALSYDASIPHWWSNLSDGKAIMLAASTPPSLGKAH